MWQREFFNRKISTSGSNKKEKNVERSMFVYNHVTLLNEKK
jgi:hypothetical protein